MKSTVGRLFGERGGATAAEYALVLALIAGVISVVGLNFGKSLKNMYQAEATVVGATAAGIGK